MIEFGAKTAGSLPSSQHHRPVRIESCMQKNKAPAMDDER
jgi:hypothetical protein